MNVIKFDKTFNPKQYLTITVLGKTYKLTIKPSTSPSINLVKKDSQFFLILPKKYINSNISETIIIATKKLYSEIAPSIIEDSLELARFISKFAPEDYKINRIPNSFFKIISKQILVVNPDIVKYNKDIINTSMIQEFCKIKFNPKTKIYKSTLSNALKEYEQYKKKIKNIENYKTGTI